MMNYKTILFSVLLISISSFVSAQSSDDYEKYKQEQQAEYSTYVTDRAEAYKKFVKEQEEWDAMLLGGNMPAASLVEDKATEAPTYVDASASLVQATKELNKTKDLLLKKLAEGKGEGKQEKSIDNSKSKRKEVMQEVVAQVENQIDLEKNAIPSGIPVIGKYRISSPFGYRVHPIYKKRKFHGGVDIACPQGTPVKSVGNGTVVYAGHNGGYGNYIIVDHGNGYKTAFAHLEVIKVTKGQEVNKDATIGTVGSTGRSTGAHLHYEIIKNEKKVNPASFMNNI